MHIQTATQSDIPAIMPSTGSANFPKRALNDPSSSQPARPTNWFKQKQQK
jgi:hypothetical protein